MIKPFQKAQFEFTQYLRDPDSADLPDRIQPERMRVYVELIYNNIEGFISGAFPVLRSIIPDQEWHLLVRDFIRDHSAQTPYFLQISQEFLTYLMENASALQKKYPFVLALAHYEWVELALDIAEDELPEVTKFPVDLMLAKVNLSPVAFILAYPWPVHKISPQFIPSTSEDETHLLVYRNRNYEVKFMALNATSSRLLQLCRDNPSNTLTQHLGRLEQEIGATLFAPLREKFLSFFHQLHQLDLVFFGL